MVQVGNFNINFGSGSWLTVVKGVFWGGLVFILIAVFLFLAYRYFKNKAFYRNPVTLTMYYDNGTKKRNVGLKGGKFINSSGVWDFKVSIPKQLRKKELGYMPDFSKADSDGTLHFITSGDGTIWLQVAEKLSVSGKQQARDADGKLLKNQDGTPKMIDNYILFINPVRTDVKQSTVNSLRNWREMVSKQKLTAFGIAIGAFLIMVIAHLISLYIQTKIKCPAVP